jgi:hypothetical protein
MKYAVGRWQAIAFLLCVLSMSSCSVHKLYNMQQRNKVYAFEQINFNDVLKAYMTRAAEPASLEGIYSVSIIITKKGKGLLSSTEKERVIERKENERQVAIIKDIKGLNREYVEIPMETGVLPSYSVRGEFSKIAENSVAVYQRLEKRGRSTSFTFSFDKHFDVLEGVRTEDRGNFTITEKLTYLKIYPR